MAVRDFNGSGEILNTATGGASGMTFGTVAAIFKLSALAENGAICHLHDSGGTFLASPMYVTTGGNPSMFSGSELASSTALSLSVWYLVLIRKGTGAATPRYSVYNFNTDTWAHTAGGGTLPNWTAPGASGTLRFNFQNSADWLDGRVAVRALWSNSLPFTADTAGDTALEAAALEAAAQNWMDESPSVMQRFNQAATSTAVTDDTGGGADQTSITGTTVIVGDDPPGFDFTLGGGGTSAVWSHDVLIT